MGNQVQNENIDLAALEANIGHKIKFQFTEDSPVTGIYDGAAGKIGMITVGKEQEGILLEDIVGVTDYGPAKRPAEKATETKAAGKSVKQTTAKGKTEKTQKVETSGQPKTSKKAQAAELFRQHKPGSRKEAIELLMSELGMTKAGASTYHSNLKSELT